VIESISGDCMEIQAEFSADARTTAMGLRVRRNIEISFNPKDAILTADGVKKLIACERQVKLRVFLDKRVMQVYAGDGAAAIFKAVTAAPSDLSVEAFAAGGAAQLVSLKAWLMRPASFSLDRYKV